MAMSMKDELMDLLRDRFSGHELEVPDSVWENVSGHLAASASGEGLRETLQEKFRSHEVDVDPSAWSNISSQLGHGAAAGSSFTAAWIAAGITAVAITAGVFLWNTRETRAPAVAAPIENVTQQPVAALAAASKNTPETVIPASAASAKSESASVNTSTSRSIRREAAHKQTSPAVAMPTVQKGLAPANTEDSKDLSPALKSTTSGTGHAPSETGASTPRPAAPTVPQPDPSTANIAAPGTPDPGTQPENPKEDVNAHAPADSTSSVTPAPNGDDPFTKTDAFNMFFPNTFTPNGDGDNDEFGVIVGPHLNALIQIFSMNGSLVFQTNDVSQWWNGHLPNGNIAEEGSYTCIVQVTDLDGKTHVKKKVISLYRTLNP